MRKATWIDRRHIQSYEKLLKSIASMCATNATVDWDDKDASEEFKAISNEITWGLYEIDTNGTYREEATE